MLLEVESENDDFNFFTLREQFRRVVDTAGPGHFGDVNEAFDAVLKLHECAIRHNVDHVAFDLIANGVALFNAVPWGQALLLDTKGNALAFAIDAQDHDLELVANGNHLGGVLQAAPRHIGDVQKAIDTAKVDEHAEVGDVLDRAHTDLLLEELLHKAFTLLSALFFKQFAPGDDDVHSLRVNLDDARTNRFTDELGDVMRSAQVDLACRQEDVDAFDVDEQSTFDLALDFALNFVTLIVLLRDGFPCGQAVCAALGKHCCVRFVQSRVVDIEDLSLYG